MGLVLPWSYWVTDTQHVLPQLTFFDSSVAGENIIGHGVAKSDAGDTVVS